MHTDRLAALLVASICVTGLLLASAAPASAEGTPPFKIIERQIIKSEMLWFNGREGDFEQKPFMHEARIYVWLTDLMRHIGGSVVRGPAKDYIELQRNETLVQIIPGSQYVVMNGLQINVQRAPIVRAGKTYVPLRFYCNLFGIPVEWNKIEQRAYVTFATE